jgi:SAM-dependent methyltransferase
MFKKITRKNLEKFLASYATQRRILDVGSGGSHYGKFFPNRLTVDIDPARHPEIVADASELPFENEEFETVLCTEMLEHVRNPFKVEEELRRVTKKGGVLILSTRFVFPLHDTPHDYWRYTKYGLRELFKNWEILELKDESASLSAVGALLQRVCFQSKFKMNKAIKFGLFSLAWLFDHSGFLLMEEYGDIGKNIKEKNIMSTGYYIVCKKK